MAISQLVHYAPNSWLHARSSGVMNSVYVELNPKVEAALQVGLQ